MGQKPTFYHCATQPACITAQIHYFNKKHLNNVGPIRHCELPHAHSPGVASGTVARRLHIDIHDNNDNDKAWQRGPLWPHGMGPTSLHCRRWTHAICCITPIMWYRKLDDECDKEAGQLSRMQVKIYHKKQKRHQWWLCCCLSHFRWPRSC